MVRAASAIAISFALSGCTPSTTLTVVADLPPEVSWIGVALLDRGDQPVDASGLFARADSESLAYLSRSVGATSLLLVGYREADLEAVKAPNVEARGAAKLHLPDPLHPALPTPPWAGRGPIENSRVEVAEAAVPSLGASWMPSCSTNLLGGRRAPVDVRCASCVTTAEQSPICGFTLTSTDCNLKLSGQVDSSGLPQLNHDPRLGSCVASVGSGDVAMRFSCSGGLTGDAGCAIEVHRAVAHPLGQVRSTTVGPSQGPAAHNIQDSVSNLAGLILVQDGVLVAYHPESFNFSCLSSGPGQFIVLDPDSLAVKQTIGAPPCLTKATSDGQGGFFAIYGGPAPKLGQFDGRGQPQRELPLDTAGLFVTDLALSTDAQYLGLSTSLTPLEQSTVHGGLLAIDLASWSVALSTRTPSWNVFGIAPTGPHGFAVVMDGLSQVQTIEVPSGELHSPLSFSSAACGSTTHAARLLIDGSGRFLVPASGQDGHHWLSLDQSGACTSIGFYEWDAFPYVAAPWPKDPSLMVVGLESNEQLQPVGLALYDPINQQFLSGGIQLGRGFVGAVVPDTRGRIWVTLPEEATVLRIDPP